MNDDFLRVPTKVKWYKDFTLSTMRKWDLIRYIRKLEEIIEDFDAELNKQYKEIERLNNIINKAIEYLEAVNKSHQKMFVLVDKQYLLDILKGDEKNE